VRLADAKALLLYRPGIETLSLKVLNGKKIQATLKIASNAPIGFHPIRIRTATGISSLRLFSVGSLPVLTEVEPNDPKRPQAIPLERTVEGIITTEDVDVFGFQARKGQRIHVELEGLRLGNGAFDPYLAIYDARGFEVATCDDSALLGQDPHAGFTAQEDGTYTVRVRESAYRGGPRCAYRLHIGTFPRPTALLPSGGQPGETLTVRLLGDPRDLPPQQITLPADPLATAALLPQGDQGLAPSALALRISPLPNRTESPKNDSRKNAPEVEIPGAINGVLERPGDVDWIRFQARKGQTLDIQVHARTLGSPVDPWMAIFKRGGKYLAGNDDARAGIPDSRLRFRVPETGAYDLVLRDLLRRGGSDFAYRIEIGPARQGVTLGIPKYARKGQTRQVVAIPRGGRVATLITVTRENVKGAIRIESDPLPNGVTLRAPKIPANVNQIPVVFEATSGTPLGGTLLPLTGHLEGSKKSISGPLRHRVELAYGPPNNAVYTSHTVNRLAVGIVKPHPILLDLVAPKAPLSRSGAMNLKLRIERRDGFQGKVICSLLFRPPGVGAGTVTFEPKQTERTLRINANGKAALGQWPLVVVAKINQGGDRWTSSKIETLQIVSPYAGVKIPRSVVEQGRSIEIVCPVTVHTPFEGSGTLRLLRLPHGTTAAPVPFDAQTKQVTFRIQASAKTRPARYKNLYCQVNLPVAGEQVLHATGRGELRVDRPPRRPKNTAKKPPKSAPKQPAKASPLSRLESLRREEADRKQSREPTAKGSTP
jgi:hypothetical protein